MKEVTVRPAREAEVIGVRKSDRSRVRAVEALLAT